MTKLSYICSHMIILDGEIETVYAHICRFLSTSTQEKCWENIFSPRLNISNFLQVIEICVVLPLSSTEVSIKLLSLTVVWLIELTKQVSGIIVLESHKTLS